MITDKPTDTDTNMDTTTNDGDTTNNGDTTANQSDATNEAQQIMDSLDDKPEVCEALYELLDEKYNPTPQPTSGSTPKMMDMEGLPQE